MMDLTTNVKVTWNEGRKLSNGGEILGKARLTFQEQLKLEDGREMTQDVLSASVTEFLNADGSTTFMLDNWHSERKERMAIPLNENSTIASHVHNAIAATKSK